MPRLEHIGIAVDDVGDVVDRFDELFGVRPYKHETVSSQAVRTHFLDAHSAKLELLESTADDSPVRRFLERRGEGLHHLAFEVDDLEETIHRLRDAGVSLLSDAPQPGADDKRIVFVHPKDTHGVLVEFCETTAPDWSPRLVGDGERSRALYERGASSRPLVLFLHGAAGSTRLDTAPLMRALEPSFHTVGLDLSGHGASPLPSDGTLTLDRLADDVETVLDALGASRCHLFGFSLGTAVALHLAHRSPERVRRLALHAPNNHWTSEQVAQFKAYLDSETIREQRPDEFRRLQDAHASLDPLLASLGEFAETLPDVTETLRQNLSTVEHPTLVSGLDRDPMAPVSAVQAVHEQLPNATLSILPGSRHTLADGPVSVLAALCRDHFGSE